MSLVSEILAEARGATNALLGNECILVNPLTGMRSATSVIITHDVDYFQGQQFAGVVTTGVFDRNCCSPLIGHTLLDQETGAEYELVSVKTETPSKLVFILQELN